ncbi:MAG: NRDE family protein, partial [Myxococcales bacterium]|nr:NRDE family protein [Polyangiaceae bacterium]MDW8249143.1 NRDE family protein [Myxococcales bacterium]
MCIIVAAFHLHGDFTLLIAANRDEFLGRPTLPPGEIRPGILAGIDLEKGGTWMGATRSGLFVGLTNQRTDRLLPPAPRSRGEIVLAALEAGTLDGALQVIQSLDPACYNPFNLLLGDAERLFVAYSWKAPRIDPTELPPGLHVLTNDRLGSPLHPKALRAKELIAPLIRLSWEELLPALGSALADHRLPPSPLDHPLCDEELRPVALALQALCVHTDRGYGTRSSAV